MNLGIVARQFGSAEAFCALLRTIRAAQPEWVCEVWSFAPAECAFSWHKIPFKKISNFDEFSSARPRYDVLLTGTSLQSSEDGRFWQWAREKNALSCAHVDSWFNLSARFADTKPPDWFLVIDEWCAKQLSEYPCRVVGNWALENVGDVRNLREFDSTAVFVTEPSSFAGGQIEFQNKFGFTDEMAWPWAVKAVEHSQLFSQMLLKLHPRDKAQRWEKWIAAAQNSNLKIAVTDWDKYQTLERAGLVLGMTSFLLLEAESVGVPTISLQPARKFIHPAIENSARIERILSEDQLAGAVAGATQKAQKKTEMTDASLRFIQWLKTLKKS